jgi:hypothetical protein
MSITKEELHEHIQQIFVGRPIGEAEGKHWDSLQWRLHELVDKSCDDVPAVQRFVERVKLLAAQYEQSTGSIHSWYSAMSDVLTDMEHELAKEQHDRTTDMEKTK